MPNGKQVVSASLANGQRALILRQIKPRFEDVYCYQLTWEYDIPTDTTYSYPRGQLELTLTGRHIGNGHEALVGKIGYKGEYSDLGTRDTRPDGGLLHITLSTSPGVPPKTAGQIDPSAIVPIRPIKLYIQLHVRAASRLTPQRSNA